MKEKIPHFHVKGNMIVTKVELMLYNLNLEEIWKKGLINESLRKSHDQH